MAVCLGPYGMIEKGHPSLWNHSESRHYISRVESHMAGDCISMMQASVMEVHPGRLPRISFHKICILLTSHHLQKSLNVTLKPTPPGT